MPRRIRCVCNRGQLRPAQGKSHHQFIGVLVAHTSKSTAAHDDVTVGLLFSVLTNQPNAEFAGTAFEFMAAIVREGNFRCLLSNLRELCSTKYDLLLPRCRHQLTWLVGELIGLKIKGTDTVVAAMLRLVAGGDVSNENLWLCEQLLNMLVANRGWLLDHTELVQAAFYTFLRLIEDHAANEYSGLRDKEAQFCLGLWQDAFAMCCSIGRDAVRLLQNVSEVVHIQDIWKGLVHQPGSLAPGFKGVAQMLATPTHRRLLASRLTPTMEKWILFMLTKVPFGQQKRHQRWFVDRFLSAPENHTLISDLIRYIVCNYHPTNEALGSGIIPR